MRKLSPLTIVVILVIVAALATTLILVGSNKPPSAPSVTTVFRQPLHSPSGPEAGSYTPQPLPAPRIGGWAKPPCSAPTTSKATATKAEKPEVEEPYSRENAEEMASMDQVWLICYTPVNTEFTEACAHWTPDSKTLRPFHDIFMDAVQYGIRDPAANGNRCFGIIRGWPERLYACHMKPWHGEYQGGRPVWELDGRPRLVKNWRRGRNPATAIMRYWHSHRHHRSH
jgi:hypothetical protein